MHDELGGMLRYRAGFPPGKSASSGSLFCRDPLVTDGEGGRRSGSCWASLLWRDWWDEAVDGMVGCVRHRGGSPVQSGAGAGSLYRYGEAVRWFGPRRRSSMMLGTDPTQAIV